MEVVDEEMAGKLGKKDPQEYPWECGWEQGQGYWTTSGMGVTKALFANFSITGKSKSQIISIMFIFARCLRSLAAVTPAKYELGIIQVQCMIQEQLSD